MEKRTFMQIWKESLTAIWQHPILVVPFVFLGIIDGLGLLAVYWAPRYPISRVLAPIIRAYWGDAFLHYPANFLLLPKLYQGSHVLVTAIVGVLMSGIAIVMLQQAFTDQIPTVMSGIRKAFSRYTALFIAWIVVFIIVTFFSKAYSAVLTRIVTRLTSSPIPLVDNIIFWFGTILSIGVEALFIYSFPIVILNEKNPFRALIQSFSLARRTLKVTIPLVLIPSALFFIVIFLKLHIAALSRIFPPEIVLWILWCGVVITAVVDCFITLSTAVFFIHASKEEVA